MYLFTPGLFKLDTRPRLLALAGCGDRLRVRVRDDSAPTCEPSSPWCFEFFGVGSHVASWSHACSICQTPQAGTGTTLNHWHWHAHDFRVKPDLERFKFKLPRRAAAPVFILNRSGCQCWLAYLLIASKLFKLCVRPGGRGGGLCGRSLRSGSSATAGRRVWEYCS